MKTTAQISVSHLKAHCTRIIREFEKQPPESRILVTNRGRVVATIAPRNEGAPVDPASWLGSLQGTVVRYDEPFSPASAAGDWLATRA